MDARQTTRPDRESKETLWRELGGVVERITYQHPETGFTVARLLPERERDAAGRRATVSASAVRAVPSINSIGTRAVEARSTAGAVKVDVVTKMP